MEDKDRKVSLNPNLFELGKLRLMLNSSPAEILGDLQMFPHVACPAINQPQGPHDNTRHGEVYT